MKYRINMLKILYLLLFRYLGVLGLYRDIVVNDRLVDIKPKIRADLVKLLITINRDNAFFRGQFDQFLVLNESATDEEFFSAYANLPSFSKQDYALAGNTVMDDRWTSCDQNDSELELQGNPATSIAELRRGNFLTRMATGGSTSLPLVVCMTKIHMFSALFTFFKCWYRMGWRPGERILVFYPTNTYNIDDMVKFNPYSKWIGFKYHLFETINERTVKNLVNEINSFKPTLLLVFPSTMNMVAHTIRRTKLNLHHQPALINVSGETFFDCQRINIQNVFPNSKIEDSYGSVELGELAHETHDGIEIFANVAYVETELNEAGYPEMIISRLGLSDFPFVRYRMRDIATVEFKRYANGTEKFLITRIEGKDTNYIVSDNGDRCYPSVFNQLVNELNSQFSNSIIEIKVYEHNQRELEIQYIVCNDSFQTQIINETCRILHEKLGARRCITICFVDYIDHDYRRKYRAIERGNDVEFAGGLVGVENKLKTVASLSSNLRKHERRPQ